MSQHTPIQQTRHHHAAQAPQFASILIVDDQRFDRSRLKRLCAQLEFITHVAEAESLAVLRDKLRKDRYDLILLDYHLTDGTGLEGVDAIRADTVNHSAAIVMVTGTQEHDIAVQALKMGMSDYLTKDELCAETLARTAITALQKAQLVRAAAAPVDLRPPHHSVQQFSRDCAQDIKPIVSRMMRQMRELRDIERLAPEEALQRVDRVEGSLRRLWAFLDDLDQMGGRDKAKAPSVSARRGGGPLTTASSINLRVPSERPRPSAKSSKPPSVFRRRPDTESDA
jgi:CheY-like chemotaxis protein